MSKVLPNLRIYLLGSGDQRVTMLVRLAQRLKGRGWPRLAKLVLLNLQRNYGVYIHEEAEIAETVQFRHPTGVVIGKGVVVEDNVIIYQQVTLGGARSGDMAVGNYPTVRAGATLFAGAKILGNVTIGENSTVGANAVVLSDVPSNHIAVGIPARILPQEAKQ